MNNLKNDFPLPQFPTATAEPPKAPGKKQLTLATVTAQAKQCLNLDALCALRKNYLAATAFFTAEEITNAENVIATEVADRVFQEFSATQKLRSADDERIFKQISLIEQWKTSGDFNDIATKISHWYVQREEIEAPFILALNVAKNNLHPSSYESCIEHLTNFLESPIAKNSEYLSLHITKLIDTIKSSMNTFVESAITDFQMMEKTLFVESQEKSKHTNKQNRFIKIFMRK